MKKTPDAIRMIIDARVTNAHHRHPPITRLGSASNFADLDLSSESLSERLSQPEEEISWGTEMDVSDCFYQFQLKEMGSWFGIDFPKVASDWAEHGFDVDTVYNEDRGIQERVRPDEVLYPVLNGLDLGALFCKRDYRKHSPRNV